jgi:hypothetical protein
MPRLLRTMARTTVIAGTATATANAVNRRQMNKNAQAYAEAQAQVAPPPQEQYAPAPPPASAPAADDTDEMLAQLERLAQLKAQGILTEEEFAAQKAKILGM